MENTDYKLIGWSVIPVISSKRRILNAYIFTSQLTYFKSFFTYCIFKVNCKNLSKHLKPVYIHFSVGSNTVSGHLDARWGKCQKIRSWN